MASSRLLSGFYVTSAVAILIAMLVFGIAVPQPPFSDFLMHWEESLDFSKYVKGGGLIFIYRFVSFFITSPDKAALLVNSISWIAFAWACYPGKINQGKLGFCVGLFLPIALLAYGFWWIAVSSTVEVMTIHAACFCAGLRLIFAAHISRKKLFLYGGIILLSLGLSMRIQAIMAIGIGAVAVGTVVLIYLIIKGSPRSIFAKSYFWLPVVISMLVACGVEGVLRSQSQMDYLIDLSQKSQFYIGLLSPDTSEPNCGGWNPASVQAAEKELDIKLPDAFKQHLAGKSPHEMLGLMACKLKRAYGSKLYVWWIPRNSYNEPEAGFGDKRPWVFHLESYGNKILRLSIIILLLAVFFRKPAKYEIEHLSILVLLIGFTAIYAVLEFNPRYQYQLIAALLFFVAAFIRNSSNAGVSGKTMVKESDV